MTIDLNTPLKYHMNDLVYYLGMSTGGNLGKQIAYLGAIGAMMKGMLYRFTPESVTGKSSEDEFQRRQYAKLQDQIDTFVIMVDMISKAYTPMMDSNPYMFNHARRIRKAVHIAEVLAFHIIEKNGLVSGNMMRARLVDQFGKDRIKSPVSQNDQ